jgi:hypothetical protein
MTTTLCLLRLARDLAKLASETRDPETAAGLIALVNEVLVAAGHLPKAAGGGSSDGNGGARKA